MLFRARSSARATFATSSRKSTFGMGADFADNRPIVGTELGQRLGQSKGFHARRDRWGCLRGCRYLLHGRDAKFCESFRELIRTGSVNPLRLPATSPNLNSYAERWVRSVKEECRRGWSCLENLRCGEHCSNISYITRKTARTSAWRRRRRRAGRLSHARPNHANLGPCLASAVFIIGTPGRQLRDRSRPRSDDSHGRMTLHRAIDRNPSRSDTTAHPLAGGMRSGYRPSMRRRFNFDDRQLRHIHSPIRLRIQP